LISDSNTTCSVFLLIFSNVPSTIIDDFFEKQGRFVFTIFNANSVPVDIALVFLAVHELVSILIVTKNLKEPLKVKFDKRY